ncbi:MAG: hypothetical protein ACOYN8_05135 [Pseudanabaena sp.]|jgi:hypothetical protein
MQGKTILAAKQWSICIEFTKPETFNEYKVILRMNPEVGRQIDSKAIFN